MKSIITLTGIKAVINNKKYGELPSFLSEKEVDRVRKFHSSINGYKATPLTSLENLAKELGVSKIYVKDESYRFGLNAFKGVGATYAIARVLCEKLGVDIDEVTFDYFKSPEVSEK
ncbi:MAG: diaminopropionate ammonia-lyase, partial [Bacillota bacterium]